MSPVERSGRRIGILARTSRRQVSAVTGQYNTD